MARQTRIVPTATVSVIVRMAAPEFDRLRALVSRRYPNLEWASFARFGWRETPEGLVLTLAELEEPGAGDLDETVGHVAINEPYTLRVALASESQPARRCRHSFAPRGLSPRPSSIDDDMDGYYGRYFHDFAPGRPYVSLIFSKSMASSCFPAAFSGAASGCTSYALPLSARPRALGWAATVRDETSCPANERRV